MLKLAQLTSRLHSTRAAVSLAVAFAGIVSLTSTSWAETRDPHCFVPMRNRMPQGLLQQQLERKGWEIQSISLKYGCYVVEGLDDSGEQVRAHFDPRFLWRREIVDGELIETR